VLRHEGRELVLDAAGAAEATFGRDGGCDFIIEDRKASRQHAHVERRRDKFVLVDHSSNGTWVRLGDAAPVVLRREELMLHGSGAIGFGHGPDEPDAVRVTFALA
jgi:pSer/pThr/pTyr-binding forkhead associated (FHA) protein